MSFKDTFKSLIDPYSADDKDGFIDEVDAEETESEGTSVFSMFRSGKKGSAPAAKKSTAPAAAPRQRGIRPQKAAKSGDVRVFRPTEYETAWDIVAAMVENDTVVVNLENTPSDIGMRVMDFVLGAAYARKDDLQRVSDRTFIITPRGRALTGDTLDSPMKSESAHF